MKGLLDIEPVQRWVVVYLAVISGEDAETIDIDAPLSEFDIDSVDAVEMAMQFEKTFACEIGAEFFLRTESTIRNLAGQIVADAAARIS